MAITNDMSRTFRLYVTHVDGEGHFLKVSGQSDQQSSLMVESLFDSARENLEKGIGVVPPGAIHAGIICAAKYKDGIYYRAKILNTSNLSTGLVSVHFIDFGNKDIISLSTIRFLDSYDPLFLKLPGQATDYYLARLMNPSGRWEEPLLLKLQSLICYCEYPVVIESQARGLLPIISLQFKGNDLTTHLVTNRFGVAIPVVKQELLIQQFLSDNQQVTNYPNNYLTEAQPYLEHVPFLMNQSFPSNPASAMRLQQNISLPLNGNMPPPSMISQRLLVNKVSRNPVSLRAPTRQPQLPGSTAVTSPTSSATPVAANKPPSPKKQTTYKSKLLEIGSTHKVFVSFAEEGPELFGVQLVSDANKLQDVMDEINRRPHSSLKEPPMIGTVCLGRMSGDRIICRAIVTNLSGSQCKLFFVDFGDTEMVSYYDIFDIPEEFVKPNVFAMRFCLSGVKKLEKGPHLIEMFKQLVNGKILTLKVVAPEGPPLIQYGELYLDNNNVFDLLTANLKEKLQFKYMDMLPLGTKQAVLVSYVDSCIKFFVQPSEMINELNAVMDAVRTHCENSKSPGELPVGAACCARFPEDGNWYRARVLDATNGKLVVTYVDYGNEQGVSVADLRSITPDLVKLPAVAMKCALKGYESRPIETKTSNQLEMLALEKSLTANIVGVLSNDTMLVTLVDETNTPPLDIAKKMMQLSQPRSSIDPKTTTPPRKDAPESFSSPESSDERKKSFKRETSFKDDKRPPRDSEEFGQRGGSFRARDKDFKDTFDRSGVGRHSEKFRRPEKPDRPDRRGGYQPKPSSNASDDSWQEDSPPQNNYNPQANRFNKDNFRDSRRKPREMQDRGKPGWKSKDQGGVGKRLRMAAEIASMETQNAQKNVTVQERTKRETRFNSQNDRESNDSRPHRDNRSDRPDRRDNRNERSWGDRKDNWGEKKENWGEKKENWGDKKESWGEKKDNWGEKKDNWGDKKDNWGQKREFRDRNDKPRSNFSPRDRADRSFEQDKRSERSFRSNDSGGRAPPYKPRGKFTQVQYKELSEPVPLDTEFSELSVEAGSQHEVAITWLISPENFYAQILSHQTRFLEMMHQIPELYKGVKSYTGAVNTGDSVLARYPADGVLYRATIVSGQPPNKVIVRYVDFGNKQVVDFKDIWQLEKQLLELPKMAVHCSLLGVAAKDGEWKSDPEVDLCFNAPRYQCVFQEVTEGQHKVSLWNNGVSVADMLVEKQLAIKSEHQSDFTLKDEAVDLSIIAGQQFICRVTYVESFELFYIQLNLDKVALLEESIANYDATKLIPVPAESLSAGAHCAVKHEGKIFRAILNDTSDATQVKAVLPDYGVPITTPAENLMILPKDLTQCYYYQSLKTHLNNYTEESKKLMTLDELKEKLTNNKFIVYINDVNNGLVSTFYDAVTGKKLEIFEPDPDAYPEVDPVCARSVFNYNFGNSYISHAENLNEIYLQKASDGDKIAELLDDLFKFYEEGTPEALDTFEPETHCVAKSSDTNWYRASIISATDTEVTVQFTDYGNTETVPKESLKKLDTQFYEPCAMALVVGLGLVASQDDAVTKLVEWTNEKEVQVTLAFGDEGWLASLHLDGVDLSMKLVNENLATPRMNVEEKAEAVKETEAATLPPGCIQVYISHIDTPGHFWLQMADKVDPIEEIQANLQANASNYADVDNLEVGTLCVAKYSADEQWYRAEILDSDSDITTVRFIDYGNTDVLDNQPGILKSMPEELKETERLAIKASVNAIPSGTGQWSEPASDYFTQLIGDLANPVDVLIVLKDVTTYVDIYVNFQNITDKLVSEGHANRSEETTKCGALPSCFASHVNSPSEFWIQLENATPELQSVEAAMVDAENFPELKEKEEGVICAAKYPEDGAWYRAQVIVDGSEGTEVLFMDYGNASIANELRSLPDELKAKPALSRKCALQKPRDIKSWSRKSEIKFNELAAEGATIFNVQFIAAGDISIVELFHNGKSVTEELIGLCEEQPATERPAPIGEDLRSTGKVCYVNSADEFYVQLDRSTPEIDKMLDRLAAVESFDPATELKVGSLCAAFWTQDEQWYRSRVLEFCDVGYHVQFIDYGNKAKCEEFMQLPEDIAGIEPLAKCCRLAGIGDDKALNENVKNKIEELMTDDSTFQIEFLDSTREPALVRLLLDNKDIISLIDPIVTASEPAKTSSEIVEDRSDIKEFEISGDEQVASSTPVSSPKANKVKEGESKEESSVTVKEVESKEIVVTKSEIKEDGEVEVISAEPNEDVPVELDTSNQDLNESGDSSSTVIENKSFEGQSLCEELAAELNKTPPTNIDEPNSPEKKADQVESPVEEQKTPEKQNPKDVANKVDITVLEKAEIEDTTVVENAEKIETTVGDQAEKVDATVGDQAEKVDTTVGEQVETVDTTAVEKVEKVDTKVGEPAVKADTTVGEQVEKVDTTVGKQDEKVDTTVVEKAEKVDTTVGEPAVKADTTVGEPAVKADTTVGEQVEKVDTTVVEKAEKVDTTVREPAVKADTPVGEPAVKAETTVGEPAEEVDTSVGEQKATDPVKALVKEAKAEISPTKEQ